MSIKSAIDIEKGFHVAPIIANKVNNYICPICKTKVKLNKGDCKKCYFSHFKKEECNWYCIDNYKEPKEEEINTSDIDELEKQNKENESIFHKEGKILIKGLIENGYKISFERLCKTSNFQHCRGALKIDSDIIGDNSIVNIEYHMRHNGKSIYCDVAHLINGEVKTIYEVYHTHRTAECNRPNNIKWFDIKVSDIYDKVNKVNEEDKNIIFVCSREYECDGCKAYVIQQAEEDRLKEEEKERKKKEEEERIWKIRNLEMERERQRLLDEKKKSEMIIKQQIIKKQEEENKKRLLEEEKNKKEAVEKEKDQFKKMMNEYERKLKEYAEKYQKEMDENNIFKQTVIKFNEEIHQI